jgi:hypothetical protein
MNTFIKRQDNQCLGKYNVKIETMGDIIFHLLKNDKQKCKENITPNIMNKRINCYMLSEYKPAISIKI